MSATWPETRAVRAVVWARSGCALAMARVATEDTASHTGFAAEWLAGEERARGARFLVPAARADFLAGRIAAKTALRGLVPDLAPPAAWEIRRGANHQPVTAHVAPRVAVTLAHAGGVGLALAHDVQRRSGIDLEPLDRAADDVIATQVTAAEADWARAAGGPAAMRERWLLLWTAREAQGKSLGTGILEPARLGPTAHWASAPHGWRARIGDDPEVIVRAVVAGGFVASLCVPSHAEAEAMAVWLADALGGGGTR